jgi:hypothetical protein
MFVSAAKAASASGLMKNATNPSIESVSFYPEKVTGLVVGSSKEVTWSYKDDWGSDGFSTFQVETEHLQIADVTADNIVYLKDGEYRRNWTFMLTGRFLGHTRVRVKVVSANGSTRMLKEEMAVSVIRPDTVLDKIFLYSVIGLVSLAYINMGCSLDLEVVWSTIRRPVGPLVGICCQYLCMPLVSLIIFSNFVFMLLMVYDFFPARFRFGTSFPTNSVFNAWFVRHRLFAWWWSVEHLDTVAEWELES